MTPTRCDPQAPRPEEVLRDRLLLYVRALRLPPREGLELVLKTMDELCPSGTSETLPAHAEDCDMKTAMEALRALCADRGLLPDADALPVPQAVRPLVAALARELDAATLDQHIAAYVNDFSLDMDTSGKAALDALQTFRNRP